VMMVERLWNVEDYLSLAGVRTVRRLVATHYYALFVAERWVQRSCLLLSAGGVWASDVHDWRVIRGVI
jgi:hypothetical protein